MDKLSSHYNELLDGDVTDMTSFSDSTSFDTTDDSSSQYQPSLENQEQQQSTNDSDSSLLESGSDTMWIGNALEGAIDLTTPRPVPEEETFGDKPLEKDSETSTEDKTGDKYLDADMDGHLETTGSDANGRGPGNNQDQQLEQGKMGKGLMRTSLLTCLESIKARTRWTLGTTPLACITPLHSTHPVITI